MALLKGKEVLEVVDLVRRLRRHSGASDLRHIQQDGHNTIRFLTVRELGERRCPYGVA